MLRSIKYPYSGGVLAGFQVDYSGGTPSVSKSVDDARSVTDNGDGDFTVNLFRPLGRGIPIACVGATTGIAGGYGNALAGSISSFRGGVRASSGSLTDGTAHCLALGHYSSAANHLGTSESSLLTTRAGAVLMGFGIDGTGTASIDNGTRQGTLTDAGTGDYSIALRNPYKAAPVVVGTVRGSSAGTVNPGTITNSTLPIKTYNAAGSLADFDFDFLCLGWYLDFGGRAAKTLRCPQLGPRFLALRIAISGGAASLSYGTGAATVVRNGSGDYTLTFTDKFKRAPIVVACSSTDLICSVAAKSASTAQILTFDNAGSSAEGTEVNVFVLGYDSAAETWVP